MLSNPSFRMKLWLMCFVPSGGTLRKFCLQLFASSEVTQLAVCISWLLIPNLCSRVSPFSEVLYGNFVLQLFIQTRVTQLAFHFPLGIATWHFISNLCSRVSLFSEVLHFAEILFYSCSPRQGFLSWLFASRWV